VILENDDERVQEGLRTLGQALNTYVQTFTTFNQALVDQVQFILQEHSANFKTKYGHEFPPLGVFVLPSARFIICCRKDMEDKEIHNQLLIWLRQFSERGIHPSALEVVQAVKACWPQYRPPIEALRKDTKAKIILH